MGDTEKQARKKEKKRKRERERERERSHKNLKTVRKEWTHHSLYSIHTEPMLTRITAQMMPQTSGPTIRRSSSKRTIVTARAKSPEYNSWYLRSGVERISERT